MSTYIKEIKFEINTVKGYWILNNDCCDMSALRWLTLLVCFTHVYLHSKIKVRCKLTLFNTISRQWHYFLKICKNPAFGSFLTIFDTFYPNGFFPIKSGSVTYRSKCAPNSVTSFSKKNLGANSKKTSGQTDRSYFIESSQSQPEVQNGQENSTKGNTYKVLPFISSKFREYGTLHLL